MKTSTFFFWALTGLLVSHFTTEGETRGGAVYTSDDPPIYVEEEPSYVVPEGAFDAGFYPWVSGGWGYSGYRGPYNNHHYHGNHDHHGSYHGHGGGHGHAGGHGGHGGHHR